MKLRWIPLEIETIGPLANRITTDEQKGLMAIEEDDDNIDTNDKDEDEDSATDNE